jgi:hypothetical protein
VRLDRVGDPVHERDRLVPTRCLADDVDVRRIGEHRLQSGPNDGVIVHQYDADAHVCSFSVISVSATVATTRVPRPGALTSERLVSGDGKSGSDKVKLRIAPLLTYHHLLAAETTWASEFNSAGNAAMRAGVNAANAEAGVPSLRTIQTGDPWNQDFFETGFMSMPGPNGTQHAIRVNIRSANVQNPPVHALSAPAPAHSLSWSHLNVVLRMQPVVAIAISRMKAFIRTVPSR